MNISLDSNSQRFALLALALGLAVLFCYQGVKLALASHRVLSGDLPKIQSAVALEPGNAEYRDLLGRYLQFQLDQPDLEAAASSFSSATKLSPRTARYWMDLAVARENLGQIDEAQACFGRALAAYPQSAQVHWEYGNFLLREQNIEEALTQIRGAVASDPQLTYIAITRVWRATESPARVLSVLPRRSAAFIQAVNFFSDNHSLSSGLEIWNELIALKQPFELPDTFQFFDELIKEGRSSDAERAWLQALAASNQPHQAPANGSVIWNGGFEQDIENGGLGWRVQPASGMSMDYDESIYHSGARSLRLDFEGGSNVDLAQPLEIVPVQPDHAYHFRGFIRTENITTESGLRVYILDPQRQNAVLLATDNLVGTHAWTEVAGDVRSSSNTNFLVVQVRRTPSRLFENKLGGSAWIDDLSLVPANSEPPAKSGSLRSNSPSKGM